MSRESAVSQSSLPGGRRSHKLGPNTRGGVNASPVGSDLAAIISFPPSLLRMHTPTAVNQREHSPFQGPRGKMAELGPRASRQLHS